MDHDTAELRRLITQLFESTRREAVTDYFTIWDGALTLIQKIWPQYYPNRYSAKLRCIYLIGLLHEEEAAVTALLKVRDELEASLGKAQRDLN